MYLVQGFLKIRRLACWLFNIFPPNSINKTTVTIPIEPIILNILTSVLLFENGIAKNIKNMVSPIIAHVPRSGCKNINPTIIAHVNIGLRKKYLLLLYKFFPKYEAK